MASDAPCVALRWVFHKELYTILFNETNVAEISLVDDSFQTQV